MKYSVMRHKDFDTEEQERYSPVKVNGCSTTTSLHEVFLFFSCKSPRSSVPKFCFITKLLHQNVTVSIATQNRFYCSLVYEFKWKKSLHDIGSLTKIYITIIIKQKLATRMSMICSEFTITMMEMLVRHKF